MPKSTIEDKILALIRTEFKIPAAFDEGTLMALTRGTEVMAVFDFCDASITVNLHTGVAQHTHMGLNANCDGHEFITRRWIPGEE